MAVHLVSDNIAKLSKLRGMLEKRYKLKSELLSHADLRGKEIEAVVVAADLRDVNNITAIKEISPKLARPRAPTVAPSITVAGGRDAAFAGAACIASMFTSVLSGEPIDVDGARNAGAKIAETIAENGLSDWLATVRRHHEGTYQHCLLVTGVTVDFGLSLGVTKADLERLYMAAMFHDIGKAKIPLAILDKPGDRKSTRLNSSHDQ